MAKKFGATWIHLGAKALFALMCLGITFYVTGASIGSPTATARSTGATLQAPRAAAVSAPASTPAATVRPASAPAEGPFVVRGILDIPGPLRPGDYAWEEAGVPPGPIVITVDLAAQTLSVFRGGFEIGTAVILYGADSHPTPLGVFPITEKNEDHISNLYNVPMPYMLRMTNDGISIHGAEVEPGKATHGCIGVPHEFAALLFEEVKLGDVVIVTNGERLQMGERIIAA